MGRKINRIFGFSGGVTRDALWENSDNTYADSEIAWLPLHEIFLLSLNA